MISSTSSDNPFNDSRASSSGVSASYLPLEDDESFSASSSGRVNLARLNASRPPVLTLSSSAEPSPTEAQSFTAKQKGKSREIDSPWGRDVERGIEEDGVWVEVQEDAEDAYSRAARIGEEGAKAYPPVSEEEAEERQIKENLALFAARELARRRAARASRQFPSHHTHTPASSIGSGTLSSSSAGKRSSIFGFFRGGAGVKDDYAVDEDGTRKRDSNVPLTAYGQPPGISSPPPSRPASANPFEESTPSPSSSNPFASSSSEDPSNDHATGTSTPRPHPNQSKIESQPTPLPRPLNSLHRSESSSTNSLGWADQASPVGEDGYKGQSWRGGAVMGEGMGPQGQRGEKWWHALCAWGDDLDEGGEGGQAGRTNPFE